MGAGNSAVVVEPAAMRADAESSLTESRTDFWSQDGARNPWSAPTTELWAPTPPFLAGRPVVGVRHLMATTPGVTNRREPHARPRSAADRGTYTCVHRMKGILFGCAFGTLEGSRDHRVAPPTRPWSLTCRDADRCWVLVYRILYRFLASLAWFAVRSGRSKDLEIIVLSHQLTVLRRQDSRSGLADEDRTLLGAIAATLSRRQ